ncbi:MAG TPA: copper resistance CopC family protein [Methylibium sp.]|nr:copper resistance CopC family protein [Methylibium sp.]
MSAAASAGVHAHSYLAGSEPPANATVAQLPPEVRLRFSESLEPAFISIVAQRDDTPLEPQPTPVLGEDGKTVRLRLPPGDAAGRYSVMWSIVAKDGHRTQGRIDFRVKPR